MSRQPPRVPRELRGCRNCRHGRNLDRRDRDDPLFVCRFDERSGQRGLPGMSALPERAPHYLCEGDRWEAANDE